MASALPSPLDQLPSRSRILTNSAAEFLELRGEEALGSELAEISPEFVPELDQFVTRDSVPSQDYFAESQERLEKFKATLAAFQENLVGRRVDQNYEIEIKDSSSYTLQDVLKIAQTVQKKHKDADKIHSCMGRLRKFFHATGRNATTFKKLLAFVPDDIYGSVICGGFTVILGTLERLETLRTEIYAALDKIPRTLRRIHDWLDVHYQSPQLKSCGDEILVAIFSLLELIVKELSGSLGKKILKSPFKGEKYGATIDEAIEALSEAVKDFETEARICDSKRLGQVDVVTKRTLINTAQIDATAKKTEYNVHQLTKDLTDMAFRQEKFVEQFKADQSAVDMKLLANTEEVLDQLKQAQLMTEKQGAQVHQVFYCFLTANPSFDQKTGTLDPYQARRRIARALTPISTTSEEEQLGKPEPLTAATKSLMKSWIKVSRNAPKVSARDLKYCFAEVGAKPTLAEQDRIAYILTAPELRTWLLSMEPSLLVVDIQAEGGEYSVASYASAMLAHAVKKSGMFPVLYHFCTVRTASPDRTDLAGITGLYISLIAQLLKHMKDGHEVNVELADKARQQLRNGRCKARALRKAFIALVQQLPRHGWLHVIVDSIWKLQTPQDEEEVTLFLSLAQTEETRIKMFVTQPHNLDVLEAMQSRERRRKRRTTGSKKLDPPGSTIITLEVPDEVDGHRAGLSTSWIQSELVNLVDEYSSLESDSTSEGESRARETESDSEGPVSIN